MAAPGRGRALSAGGADRQRQDPGGVSLGPRPVQSAARRRRAGRARSLRVTAQGSGLRHRAQPAVAAGRHRPRGASPRHADPRQSRRRAHGGHFGARSPAPAAQPGRHPGHDARVALPASRLAGGRDAAQRAHGHRRRDPRLRAEQARLPSRGVARAPERAVVQRSLSASVCRRRSTRRRRSPASSAAVARSRSSMPASRRTSISRSSCRSRTWTSRRRPMRWRPKERRVAGDRSWATLLATSIGRKDGAATRSPASGPRSIRACSRACWRTTRRSSSPTVAGCASAWPTASTSSPRSTSRSTTTRPTWCGRITAACRTRSVLRSRRRSRPVGYAASSPPARSSWASTWVRSIWWCWSSHRARWRAVCSASAGPGTASAR